MLSDHDRTPTQGPSKPMTDPASRPSALQSPLQVQQVNTPGSVLIRLHGELDIGTAPELERHLSAVDYDGVETLLIDLEHVEFMDSTGLALILRAAQRAATSGYQLHLRSGPRQVQRLFALTGLLDRFTFED